MGGRVWVDPPFRQRGIGSAIVDHAVRAALATGANPIYLCALPTKRRFYQGLGWSLHEQDVGEHRLDVFTSIGSFRNSASVSAD